jgi:hypothetical protein
MNDCEIFFSEDDELVELYFIEKGWRGDIIVKIGDDLFKPEAITPDRLLSEFNYSIDEGRVYDISPCLILAENVKKETIIKTIAELARKGYYFGEFKPIDLKKEFSKVFQELQDLKNWVKVY